MPFYLIKNNFKLMLRSKWIILLMIVGPIISVAALSSAFDNMMKTYESEEKFTVGYYVEEGSFFENYIELIKENSKEAGITFNEFAEDDAENIMRKNDCLSFVSFRKEDYTVYTLEKHEVEGMTTEYYLNQLISGIAAMRVPNEEITIPTEDLTFMPQADAKTYYGFIYIIYFSWCCVVSLAAVVTEEKKHGLSKKFEMSSVSDFGFFMAKVIPGVLVTVLEIAVSMVIITFMNDLQWKNIAAVILILFLNIVAGTAFGIFLIYLFDNLAMVIVAAFSVVWVAGFFGGSFETYMYSVWTESVKRLSPLYHSNRAIVECSLTGNSDYIGSAVVYLLIISLVCMAGGLILAKIRKGKNS